MANQYDGMIQFYYSGKLEVARKIRRAELSARSNQESVGGSRVHGSLAPQELLAFRFSEDQKLLKFDEIESKVKEWISTFDDDTESILILRYKESCPWWQVANILNLSESTVKRRYKKYRDTLEHWSDAVEF